MGDAALTVTRKADRTWIGLGGPRLLDPDLVENRGDQIATDGRFS